MGNMGNGLNYAYYHPGGERGGRANELSSTVHAAACLIKPPNNIKKNTVFRVVATSALAGFQAGPIS